MKHKGMFLLAAIGLSSAAITMNAQSNEIEYPLSFTMQGNLLVRHIRSTDPDVHVWDGIVWVYCSQDHQRQPGDWSPWARMDGYHVFSSEDLSTRPTTEKSSIHEILPEEGKDGCSRRARRVRMESTIFTIHTWTSGIF